MRLTGVQIKQLMDALVSAFTADSLRQMVRIELNVNLEQITSGSSLSQTVFELIQWAERTGRLNELITGALNSNPGNPELQAYYRYYQQVGAVSSSVTNKDDSIDESLGQVAMAQVVVPDSALSLLFAAAQKDQETRLDLSQRGLTELPQELFALTQLVELDLSGNELSTLPTDIATLSKLSALNLADNHLQEIPRELVELVNMRSLNLGRNQLATIPASVAALRGLRLLNLSQNHISELPAVDTLSNLETLNLSRNSLQSLPPSIGALKKLKSLDVSHNQLTDLPPDLAGMKALRELILSGNQLSQLPSDMGQIPLQELNLSSNQFSEFPPAILELQGLTYLNLASNRLTQVPYAITQLTRLREISLESNPFDASVEILTKERDPQKLFTFLRQQARSSTRMLGEAKLVLVGEADAGKTSIVNRLVHDHFNTRENTTKEIVITPWSVVSAERTIKVNIWDFGGQDIMHATHQFFLTKRSVYVLVVDSRRGEQASRVEYWLKLIRSFGGDSPIIVVCNKADQNQMELNWTGLKEKYGIYEFVRACTCVEPPAGPHGIDELKEILTTVIGSLPHVNDPLPESWLAVKTQIEHLRRNYVSYDDYMTIAERYGISNSVEQKALLGYLHDLGTVLWFGDDPRLMDTNVINPKWLTHAVYQIVNSNLLFQRKGQIVVRELATILEDTEYRKKIPFIVDVMKRFELCFSIDCPQGECILVPGLLQRDQPYTGEWQDSLQFAIKYDVLPTSIITRFIVRMHTYAPNNTFWRTGIMLRKNGTRALVQADEGDARVNIVVAGATDERRRFLEVIRTEFSAIHATISNISPRELVPIPNSQAVMGYQALLDNERFGIEKIVVEGLSQPVMVRELLDGVDPPEKKLSSLQLTSRTFSAEIPSSLLPLLNQLVDAVVGQHLTGTFEQRSALLRGVPGANSLNRSTVNERVDLDLITEQLWNREDVLDGTHPLWMLIDNAVRYLGGAETSYGQGLMDLRTKMVEVYKELHRG